jgi:FkbM family methyltransferase
LATQAWIEEATMIDREQVEDFGRRRAGVISSSGEYDWVTVLDMFPMYVNRNDKSVSPHLINEGFWESWITTWVMNNIRPGDVFWDIGANTGYYGLLAYHLGAQAMAFEPNPVYAEMLRKTKARLGIKYGFYVNEFALSNYNGEATLNIPTELHGSASLSAIVPGYKTTKVTVPVASFDEKFPQCGAGRQVFKIDAEGEEERILEGMKGFLKQTPHKLVMMEYTPGAYSELFLTDLFNDWNVTWINHAGYEGAVTPEGLLRQTDWLMLVLRPKW